MVVYQGPRVTTVRADGGWTEHDRNVSLGVLIVIRQRCRLVGAWPGDGRLDQLRHLRVAKASGVRGGAGSEQGLPGGKVGWTIDPSAPPILGLPLAGRLCWLARDRCAYHAV